MLKIENYVQCFSCLFLPYKFIEIPDTLPSTKKSKVITLTSESFQLKRFIRLWTQSQLVWGNVLLYNYDY